MLLAVSRGASAHFVINARPDAPPSNLNRMRGRLLSATALLASVVMAPAVRAACAPDAAPSGSEVICTTTDSDGYASFADYLRVTVNADATVTATAPQSSVFTFTGISPFLTNLGRIDGNTLAAGSGAVVGTGVLFNVRNAGTIVSTGTSALVGGNIPSGLGLVNTGTISTTGNASTLLLSGGHILNRGSISGNSSTAVLIAVRNVALPVDIVNTGTLTSAGTVVNGAGLFQRVVFGGDNATTAETTLNLTNFGTITGNVVLGPNRDRFVTTSAATLTGNLDLGGGDDLATLFLLSPSALTTLPVTGTVNPGAGYDVLTIDVRATRTVSIPDYGFERRQLTTGIDRPTVTFTGPTVGGVTVYDRQLALLGAGTYISTAPISNVVASDTSTNRGIVVDLNRTRQDGQDIGVSPTFINRSAISLSSGRPFSTTQSSRDQAVRLDNFTRFTNEGTINVEGLNAVGISINGDRTTNGGRAFNPGTISVVGNATGAFINGGFFENSGRITGIGDGVELRADTSPSPLFTNTASGVVQVTRSAVLLRDDVPYVLNEGQLISTANAAIRSEPGVGDRPIGALVVNRGTGLIRGTGGFAIVGADGAETIRNEGSARIEGSISLAGAADRVSNSATIVGDIFTGDGSDTINNSGTITGSVSMGADGDYFQWLGGTISGTLDLGSGNDVLDINRARVWNPGAIATGGIFAGTQTSDPRRDVVSLTSSVAETYTIFATPTSFEGIRLVLENTPGVSTIANQATPYTSGFLWITGRGAIVNELDITRTADLSTILNPGIYINNFGYIPDIGDPIASSVNFTNRGTIRVTGPGFTGTDVTITAGIRVDITSSTPFTGANAGAVFADGVNSIGISLRGSDSNFSNNTDGRFVNSGTIAASNGAVGLSTARFKRTDNETSPLPGIYNTGTITATGPGSFAVSHGNSWFRNDNLISASNGAQALEIVANSTTINTGTIQSTDLSAVRYTQGDNIFVNTGNVISTTAAAFQWGQLDTTIGNISIGNAGLIQGGAFAFFGGASAESIRNEASGRIVGGIFTAAGGDAINNAGSITGNVDLGSGDDSYANLGGTLTGNLDFGTGDDTLLLNRRSLAGSGITGTINAGPGASEIDRVQVLISGSQTFDPRTTNVLAGFEVLRIDGTRSGDTLTLSNPGTPVTTRVEVELLASNTATRASAVNTANFATTNLSALETIGGNLLLANGDIGGTLFNRGSISLDYTPALGALRSDRVIGLRSYATSVAAGVELINESTITASGAISFVEFGTNKIQRAVAVATADTATEANGNRVVAPFVTNRAGAFIIGINGATAIDTEGGAIIRNEGTIRATNVAGSTPATLILGNDTVTNSGLIEGIGGGTQAIFSSSSLTLTNAATGIVRADTTAINLDVGSSRITNAGLISSLGGESAILTDSNSQRIVNTGTIVSSGNAARATLRFLQTFQTTSSGDRNFIFNEPGGRIEKAGGAGLAIFGIEDTGGTTQSGSSSAEVVFNRGTILGDVSLGDGSDVYYAIAGTQTGNISLGRDGDVLILGDGAITGGVDLGGGEDTVLFVVGTGAVQPAGGIFAGSGLDAFGPLFFGSGTATLTAAPGYELAAVGAIGYNSTITLGAIGDVLPVSIRTLGSGQFINRHTVNATFGRAALEVEDRDQRIINEGTLNGKIGIDDGDLALRLENRGTINATQFGIAARGDGIELTSEALGTVGRPVFNSGAINVAGVNGVGIFNVSSGEGRTRNSSNLGLTSVFAQNDPLPARDRPDLKRSVLISNTGAITVAGTDSVGIHTDRANAYVENGGTIRVTGTRAIGVLYANESKGSISFNTRFVNAGLLEVNGAGADGFVSLGERTSSTEPNILVNTGTIRTTGGVIDLSREYATSGFVVDFARAVDMRLGGISNSATGVIEATDAAGVAIWSRTSRVEPVENGDDPNAALRQGVSLLIVNDGLISGTKGYYAAFKTQVGDFNDSRFAYENRFIGAIQGGTGIETIENRGTIRGAINLRDDADVIKNFGTIDGDVYLGTGNDTFQVGFGSVVTGTVDAEDGVDILQLVLNNATAFDAGRYINFEQLVLQGAGVLNLTAGRLVFDTIGLGGNGLIVGAGTTVTGRNGVGAAILGTDGAETITINGTVEGGIQFGGGDDRLVRGPGSLITGTVDGGAGRDTLEITLAGAALELGGLTNFEQLDALGAGTLTISTAVTLDQVNLPTGNLNVLSTGSLSGSVLGGDAAQTFTVAGSIAGAVDTGAGNDTIVVTGSIGGNVNLGAGDDSFTQTGAGVAGIVDGGAGRDTLSVTINGNETVDLSRRINFEVLSKGGTGTLLLTSNLTLDGLTLLGGNVSVGAGAVFTVSALGIVGGAGSQAVLNAGRIVGPVNLGDDDDRVETSGVITGDVGLGAGADILVLNDGGAVQGITDGGAGTDVLQVGGVAARSLAAASFTGFESLVHNGTGLLTLTGAATYDAVTFNGPAAVDTGASLTAASITGGNGGIVLTNRGAINAPITFGSGNDVFTLAAGSSQSGALDGGAGTDTLAFVLAGSRGFSGATTSNFEVLNVTGSGTLTLSGANSFPTVQLAGTGLELASGAVLTGAVIGSAGADQLSVARSARLTGTVDLGDGDDVLVTFGQIDGAVTLGAGADRATIDSGTVFGGTLSGGDGSDTLQLAATGGSFALAGVSGFETLEVLGATTLTGTSAFDRVLLNAASLTIASGASLSAPTLSGDASANVLDIRGTFAGAANLGAGDDTLRLFATSAIGTSTFNGGDGTDTLAFDTTGATASFVLATSALTSFETLVKTGTPELVLAGAKPFTTIRSTGALGLSGDAYAGTIIGDTAAANRITLLSNVSGDITLGAQADQLIVTSLLSGIVNLGAGDDIVDLGGGAQLTRQLLGGDGNDVVRVNTSTEVQLLGGVAGIERIEKSGTGALLMTGTSTVGDVALVAGTLRVGAGGALTVTGALTGNDDAQALIIDGTFTGNASLGGGNDTLINRGVITGTIDLGAGDDTVFQSLNARLVGIIDGGAGTDNLVIEVTTQGEATASQFRNFEAISQRGGGEFRLSGNLTLDTITLMESIFTLTEGSTLRSVNQPAIQGMATNETVNVLGTIFGDIRLAGGDDIVRLGANGSVVGTIDGGAGGNDLLDIAITTSRATSAITSTGFEVISTSGGTLVIDSAVDTGRLNVNGSGATVSATGVLTGNLFGSDAAQAFTVLGRINGNLDLGGGNDVLTFDGNRIGTVSVPATAVGGAITGTIAGGAGTDQLVLTQAGVVGLNGSALTGIEQIDYLGTGGLEISGGALDANISTASKLDISSALRGNVTGSDAANIISIRSTGSLVGNLSTGLGNDVLLVQGSMTGSADLGDGDDALTIQLPTSTLAANFNGGAGNDIFTVTPLGTTTLTGAITNFETVVLGGSALTVLNTNVTTSALQLTGTSSLQVGSGNTLTSSVTGGDAGNQLTNLGTIRGNIVLGSGADSVTNRGLLDGAVSLGAGDDTFFQGLTGRLSGLVDGGAGTDSLIIEVTTQGTADASQFRNFESISQFGGGVFSLTGNLTLDTLNIADSTFRVAADSSFTARTAAGVVGGAGAETIENNGRINANIDLGGGNDTIRNLGVITGAVALGAGDDSVFVGPAGDIVGILDGGAGTDIVTFDISGTRAITAGNFVNIETIATTGGTLAVVGAFTVPNLNLGGSGLDIAAGNSLTTTLTGSDAAQTINIAGTLGGTANLGGGDDVITLRNATGLAGFVDGGAGADQLLISVADSAAVTLNGARISNIETTNVQGGAVAVTGTLTSNVTFTTTVQPTSFTVGADGALVGGITGDAGIQRVTVNGSITGPVSLGDGADVLALNGRITGAVDLGAGDDTLHLVSTSVLSQAANGGAGTDIILTTLAAGTSLTLAPQLNFETLQTQGAGTLTLSGAHSFQTVALNGATLEIAAGGSLASATPITGTAGVQTLVNSGTLSTAVDLGDGADRFVWTTSSRDASVSGGAGVDTLELRVVTGEGSTALTGYTNFEGIEKTGAGTFALGAASNVVAVTVREGSLRLDGNIVLTTPTLTVNSGATLAGNGSVAGRVIVNGTLSPGASPGTINVTGSVNFNSGSTYAAELTAGGFDRLNVTGSVTIASGATLNVTAPDFIDGNFDVITTTTGLTGTFTNLVASDFLVVTPTYTATTLRLEVISQLARGFTLQTQSRATADAFNSLLRAGAAEPIKAAARQLATIQRAGTAAIDAALDQLHPEAYAATSHIALSTARSGLDALAAYWDGNTRALTTDSGWASWASVLGGFRKIGADTGNGLSATNLDSYGLIAGLDRAVSDDARVGLYLGYSDTKQAFGTLAARSKGKSVMFGANVSTQVGGFSLQGSVGYQHSSVDLTRTLAAVGRSTSSDFGLNAISASARVGYSFELSDTLQLRPVVSLAYVSAKRKAAQETGADALNLTVQAQRYNFLMGDLGLQLRPSKESDFMPYAELGLHSNFSGRTPTATAQFNGGTGNAFTVRSTGEARLQVTGTLGASYRLMDNVQLFGRYQGSTGGGSTNHAVNAGVAVRF